MTYMMKLEKLVDENDGLIRTRDAEAAGIPRKYISMMARAGKLERLSQGIYLSPNAFEDRLFRLQLRCSYGVYSHETALFLADLSDREPKISMMTVPSGYNARHLAGEPIKLFYIQKELLDLGKTTVKTSFGRTVNCYNRERTLCDLLRSRSQMDPALVNAAFKTYIRSSEKNVLLLFEYSARLGVQKLMRSYLEVLL
ncbi:MAG: abortive phage infection protein [Clostridiaceae bacterium]|nr:abortive phage infection protein [Clostridiaceae bacterium]